MTENLVCIGTLSRDKGYIPHDPPIPITELLPKKPPKTAKEMVELWDKTLEEFARRKAMP